MKHCVLLSVLLACVVACTPMHTVKPLPNFVSKGLAPGDRVTVTDHDGQTHEFVIVEIRGAVLMGDSVEFALQDLASIQKHSWERPESPCGGEKPLGCSVPFLVAIASELHSHYQTAFYDACAQHDYCYRHGQASYGLDQDACDDEFLVNLQNACPTPATGTVGKVVEALDDSLESRNNCLLAADDFHAAARRYGERHFQTGNSTYCEYNGPPRSAAK